MIECNYFALPFTRVTNSLIYAIIQANSQRQGSQGSLFEQFTTQAKELVKETKRQSSQDGLLAQVDKVTISFFCKMLFNCETEKQWNVMFCINLI